MFFESEIQTIQKKEIQKLNPNNKNYLDKTIGLNL